jgi:hypothetical protein
MPQYTIYEKVTGQVIQTGNAPLDAIESMAEGVDVDYILDINVYDSTNYIDPADKTVKSIPIKPNECSDFDWNAKSWVNNIEKAKEFTKKRIDSLREVKLQEPITYDNKVLDADARAINNILSKYTELSARSSIGKNPATADLVWRDYNNNIHSWNNVVLYRRWIEEFTIAIAQRGTKVYKRSWILKDTVDNLTDFDEILNLDIESGWDAE